MNVFRTARFALPALAAVAITAGPLTFVVPARGQGRPGDGARVELQLLARRPVCLHSPSRGETTVQA